MKNEKLSFERDLWGQCNKLHQRINKKKTYLSNLLKSLEPICDIIKDLQKKLESIKILPDPTISKFLYTQSEETDNSEESNLYGIPLTINKYIISFRNLVDYYYQTFFHITKVLEDLIKKINFEKDEYNNFVKCLKSLSENKAINEKNMKFYQQKMIAAESSVLDLKRVEVIQLSINNDNSNLENKKLMEEKALQLTKDSLKPFNIYFESLKKTNEIREESIEKQKNLLYKYQYLEEEVGKTNTSIANILLQIEKIIKEVTDKNICDFQNIIHNIKINKDIRQLILDFKGNEKPEEEILFNYFPSTINFSNCDDNKAFEIYQKSIEFIKDIVEQEYPNYDRQLELNKNDLRELLYKLFAKFEKEKSVKIKEYVMNEKIHQYFLILLSKLRTNNRYKQSKILIDFLGELLNIILDESEKNKIYNNAKNCIILSQTFYYENNGDKIYLLEKIKNHKWLKSLDFWLNFGDLSILPELEKLIEKSPNITKEDILNNNKEKITSNLKKKISDVIFAQILPFVNNIKDFGIDLKVIIEITENFLHKYDYLNEEEKNNVFKLISDNQDEINQIREQYKNKILLKEKEQQDKNDELTLIEDKNIEINNKNLIKVNNNNSNNKPKEKENKQKEKEKENKDSEKEHKLKKNKEKEKEYKLKENKDSEKENKLKENKDKEKENKLKENKDKPKEKEIKANNKENKNNEKDNKLIENENKPNVKENKTNDKDNKTNVEENIKKDEENKPKEKEGKGKGFLGIFKKKDKEKKNEKTKEKEIEKEIEQDDIGEELPQKSATISLVMSQTQPKEKRKSGGLFKNFKNILKKKKKIKENKDIKDIDEQKEDEEEEIKDEIKKEEKDIKEAKEIKETKDIKETKEIKETEKIEKNIETTKIQSKTNQENKMIKFDFNATKLQPLKPVPKAPNNNIKNNDNKINPGNPFGVVLKKIDKGKKYI